MDFSISLAFVTNAIFLALDALDPRPTVQLVQQASPDQEPNVSALAQSPK